MLDRDSHPCAGNRRLDAAAAGGRGRARRPAQRHHQPRHRRDDARWRALGATPSKAGILGGFGIVSGDRARSSAFAIRIQADQIVTGTAINLLALGATGFAYREMQSRMTPPQMARDLITPLCLDRRSDPCSRMLLWSTTFGPPSSPRCGRESPTRLRARDGRLRYRMDRARDRGRARRVAGAHLALALSSGFAENMTAGRGFIALSVVIFGRWTVRGSVAGTALFGFAAALQYALQAANHGIAFHLLLATPYVVTLTDSLCGITEPRATRPGKKPPAGLREGGPVARGAG